MKSLLDPYLCLSRRICQASNVLKFYLIKKMNFRLCFLTPSEMGCDGLALYLQVCSFKMDW